MMTTVSKYTCGFKSVIANVSKIVLGMLVNLGAVETSIVCDDENALRKDLNPYRSRNSPPTLARPTFANILFLITVPIPSTPMHINNTSHKNKLALPRKYYSLINPV